MSRFPNLPIRCAILVALSLAMVQVAGAQPPPFVGSKDAVIPDKPEKQRAMVCKVRYKSPAIYCAVHPSFSYGGICVCRAGMSNPPNWSWGDVIYGDKTTPGYFPMSSEGLPKRQKLP